MKTWLFPSHASRDGGRIVSSQPRTSQPSVTTFFPSAPFGSMNPFARVWSGA